MNFLGHISALVAGVATGGIGFVLIGVIATILAAGTAAMLHRK